MRTIKKFAKAIAYIVSFAVLLYINFYLSAFAAALLFPGITDTSWAILYVFLVPASISLIEIITVRKRFIRRHQTVKQQSPEPTPEKIESIVSPASHPPISQKLPEHPVSIQTSPNLTTSETNPAIVPKTSSLQVTVRKINPVDTKSPTHKDLDIPSKKGPVINQNTWKDAFVEYGGIDAELLNIDLMNGPEFEHWCASLLAKNGFSHVEVTQGSGDHGVDIIAEKEGIRYAIQCKCYSKDLGNTPVQEVAAGKMMPQYHCQIGVVMTNRYFTKGAKELSAATGTLLWDRDWIISHLKKK